MLKEYRICMPMSVEEYNIGQLYMIARHSAENSDEKGEGVETIVNEPCHDEKHGDGQYAEKRIHLTSKLPSWIKSYIPKFIYVTEKSWNYYPYTITEYTCSILPVFCVKIWTRYENNNGSNDKVHSNEKVSDKPVVDFVDILSDDIRPHQYKENEDPSKFQSKKTKRGPLTPSWREKSSPIMCSYKLVDVSFPVFGFQTKVEEFVHKEIRNINVLAHRQAFSWIDEWHGWTIDDVRKYEKAQQNETNKLIREAQSKGNKSPGADSTEDKSLSTASSTSLASNSSSTPSSGGSQKGGFSSWLKWS